MQFQLKSKVAVRWLESSEEHNRSLALVRWLNWATDRLGVAEHVYVVGGAVRNFLINKPIKDIDVMIDTIGAGRSSEWLAKRLERMIPGISNVTTNQYGVAIISIKNGWVLDGIDMAGEVIEIAEARKESYGDGSGYKPTDVEPGTIEEDVFRREFTFNTLMWRLSEVANGVDKAQIIDLTGCGLKDLRSMEMHCPSDPDKTFSDDPSRMIRAVKFLIKYGFKIPDELKKVIRRNAPKIKNIPSMAISNLLINTIFKDPRTAKKALLALDDLGLIKPIGDLLLSSKEFRGTLEHWASNQSVLFMFDLMDVGLPIKAKIGFLSSSDRETLRRIVMGMDRTEALVFVSFLKQPSKALGDKRFLPSLAAKKGIRGRAIQGFMGKIMVGIRNMLLENPELMNDPNLLKKKVIFLIN